ncbi:anti-sigma factor family protein [Candidatus Zixiibacteriota bacterium]
MRTSDEHGYCGLVTEVFSSYLDHSLSASLERDVAAHLEECVSCRHRLEGISSLITDLKKLNMIEAPHELSWSIKRAVHREARNERAFSLLRPFPFLASAAAAAIILVMAGFQGAAVPPTAGESPAQFETLSAIAQEQLQHYILPPQIGDLRGTGLFGDQVAMFDSTRIETPSRLPGARAVSF